MSSSKKLVVGYFASHALYGFYRGYNNMYAKDAVLKCKSDLFVDKTVMGVVSAAIHLNPGLQPFTMIYAARRIEKNVRGIQLDDADWQF